MPPTKEKIILLALCMGILCLVGTWTACQEQRLVRDAEKSAPKLLQDRPRFQYPFGRMLKYYLKDEGKKSAFVFSYGSLLSQESAARTLSDITVESRKAALAFGVRRVFNYVPTSSTSFDLSHPTCIGMLNLVETKNMADVVNGVVISIPCDDIQALCQREEGYDLIPVVTTLWEEAESRHPHFFVSYTFSAPENPRMGHTYTRHDVLPIKEYHHLVRQGARDFGDCFLDLYLDKTFLADEKTSLREWEERQRD